MVLHMKYFFFPQCVLILSREPRRSPWRWRDQCACPPRFCASPPGRRPVEKVPRPGIDSRCASTSASSICTVPPRLSSRLYPFVLYTLHAFNLFAYWGLLESVTWYYEAQMWTMLIDLPFNQMHTYHELTLWAFQVSLNIILNTNILVLGFNCQSIS